MAFVGSVTADVLACYVWHESGVKTWEDLTKRGQITYGATGIGAGGYRFPAILKNVFEMPVKIISGYPGSTEADLAVERGEVDGRCGSWESVPDDWKRGKKIYVTHYNSRLKDEKADAPYLVDLAKTEEQKAILKVLLPMNDIFRPFAVSKSVPADRLKTLRDALWATVHDKDFLALAEKQGRAVIGPARGEDIDKMVAEMYETPAELVKKAANAIK
jgi:hypothetical protein